MTIPNISRRKLIIGSALLAGAPFVSRTAFAEVDPMSKEAVLFDPQVPVLGNPKGDVTIVEYFDYQCPYCKKAHPDDMRVVEEDGNVRFVMKDWPIFGPPSLYAARLTLAAGTGHAKAMSALMATKGKLTPDMIETILTKAGFSVPKLNAAYDRDKDRINSMLQRNSTQAETFGFPGTPAYIIGTAIYPGVVAPNDMKAAIATARKG
ncbi:DsbA family protein [Aurantimonas marina]|uniref:DsbA family protein n=1 Tax=Aurantimonas marina TaxID=2780508 RepID=UPI0019D3063D|nr:DsbA family protein [Aurantimonas marina]